MYLYEIVDNSRTDKNTIHSYLPLYEKLFSSKKETAKNVLEIGVTKGGSIKMWSEYFVNATIYGLDNMDRKKIPQDIQNNKNIILHTSINAYDENFVKEFADKNLKMDIIIDDGSHKLNDMKQMIQLYSPLLTNDGILIIEDVQSIDWIEELKNEVPEELKEYVFVYDLREKKGRYDDIVFVINKLKLFYHYCYRYAYEDVKTSHALEK